MKKIKKHHNFSGYNLVVTQYPNSDIIQLKTYLEPIHLGQDSKRFDTSVFSVNLNSNETRETTTKTEIIPKRYPTGLNINSDTLRCTRRKVIQNYFDYSKANKWDYFVTLTFNKDKVDRYDYDEIQLKYNNYIRHLKRTNPDIGTLAVFEQHKSAGSECKCSFCGEVYHNYETICPVCQSTDKVYAWHIHALYKDAPSLNLSEAYGKKGQLLKSEGTNLQIYNIDGFKLGHSTVTKIQDSKKAVSYCLKYMTKDMFVVTQGKRKFYPSNNLKRGEVDTGFKDISALKIANPNLYTKTIETPLYDNQGQTVMAVDNSLILTQKIDLYEGTYTEMLKTFDFLGDFISNNPHTLQQTSDSKRIDPKPKEKTEEELEEDIYSRPFNTYAEGTGKPFPLSNYDIYEPK